MFLLQLVYYGDLVVPTPAWVSYAPQAHIIGRHVRFVVTSPESGRRLHPEQLENLCRLDPGRPRIIILNYPSNPTGLTYSATELEALAEVANRYRVILLSDEIYGELHHDGDHRSIVPLYPQGTIFSSGLSKWCGAGGWRLGIFVVPRSLRWLLEAMASVASETYTSTSTPIQYAAVRAFAGGEDIENYLHDCRRILKAIARHLVEILQRVGVAVAKPAGAFYLYLDFTPVAERLEQRGIATSDQLCERLLEETGIAILPASRFGCAPGELAARLSYVNFDGRRALEELDSIGNEDAIDEAHLKKLCPQTIEGVRRLANWLRN
jgi:aspartate aminotransferase